jgi:VanZ family protein
MMSPIRQAAAWLLAAVILLWTWGPVRLRPQFGHPQLERFSAFFALGLAMALVYPERRRWVAAGVVVAAVLLEVGQMLFPGRDAGLRDVLAKMAGGVLGVLLASAYRPSAADPQDPAP